MKTLFFQLRRIVLEGRPGACVGCRIEKDCNIRGCYALCKISRVVAEREEKHHAHHAHTENPD